MSLKSIIKKIAQRKEIIDNPPVLLDIGASKGINPAWKHIADFAVCITFDADSRDYEYINDSSNVFKELHVFNKIVVEHSKGEKKNFFLTKSPYCSSFLEPNPDSLRYYHFADSFKVVEKVEIETIELNDVLDKTGINRIDWFKTDSQGTDLRLFKSVNDNVQNAAMVVEFEPGFFDAYIGEDKVNHILNYHENNPNFYLVEFKVKGPIRLPEVDIDEIYNSTLSKKIGTKIIKPIPGWAEITFMNQLESGDALPREFILGWLFATLLKHHEIAYTYAKRGYLMFKDPFFEELQNHSRKTLRRKVYTFSSLIKLIKRYTTSA